jgi:hypothetical protein
MKKQGFLIKSAIAMLLSILILRWGFSEGPETPLSASENARLGKVGTVTVYLRKADTLAVLMADQWFDDDIHDVASLKRVRALVDELAKQGYGIISGGDTFVTDRRFLTRCYANLDYFDPADGSRTIGTKVGCSQTDGSGTLSTTVSREANAGTEYAETVARHLDQMIRDSQGR